MLRNLVITFSVLSLTSCAGYEYDESEKVNFIDSNRGIVKVTPPQNCPNWTKFNGTDYDNRESSNFGCATINNYGQMVADPHDLISGKSSKTYSGQSTSNAVNAYNAGAGAGAAGAEQ